MKKYIKWEMIRKINLLRLYKPLYIHLSIHLCSPAYLNSPCANAAYLLSADEHRLGGEHSLH